MRANWSKPIPFHSNYCGGHCVSLFIYFLRMYLRITHIWKMVMKDKVIKYSLPSQGSCNPSTSNITAKIQELKNSKAQKPKKRPRNFFCFCINTLSIINSYLSLKRKNPSKEPIVSIKPAIPSQFVCSFRL